MKKPLIRFFCLVCLCLTCLSPALAELTWPALTTTGQTQLAAYISRVNENLVSLGRMPVNSVFECYPGMATLGVTSSDGADIPEDVQLYVTLYDESINVLQLRVSSLDQFAALAGCCIQAASPASTVLSDAMVDPSLYMNKALSNPSNSFEDPVTELNGSSPRTYYAYYPNQYQDGVNWLQLTLVFPMAGAGDAGIYATPSPEPSVEPAGEYEGYNPSDGLTHLEIFTTATPEPDSAAGSW